MNEVHISIQNLTKRFEQFTALDSISLEINRGDFTTFLGPSGCGKTTMLRTIAGFYDVDGGSIYIGDRKVNDLPSHMRNATMVFQDYALFPHMTIGENIAYGLKIRSLPKKEIQAKVEATVQYLGLSGLEQRQPGQISGGQQQRVALARALVMEPEVLLLDEPLSNLDAKLRLNIRAELRQLQKRLGITTIYVTHDQSEALALSDQVAVMKDGKIEQFASPWDIYYKPRTQFVADFVGIANLVNASVVSAEEQSMVVETDDGLLHVKERLHTCRPGNEVVLCIRPETIRLSEHSGTVTENAIKGTVETYIFEGPHIRYWIRTPSGAQIIVDAFDPSDKHIFTGDVLMTLDPAKLHIIEE